MKKIIKIILLLIAFNSIIGCSLNLSSIEDILSPYRLAYSYTDYYIEELPTYDYNNYRYFGIFDRTDDSIVAEIDLRYDYNIGWYVQRVFRYINIHPVLPID